MFPSLEFELPWIIVSEVGAQALLCFVQTNIADANM